MALMAMVHAIDSGRFDFVIGSRALGKREEGSMAGHQLAAGLVAGALIWLLYGIRYTDMCAYRAIRRNALLALGMRELTYGWNLEMQMRVARAGLRVLELPVAYRRRAGGRSKVAGSLRGTLRSGLHIITAFSRVQRRNDCGDRFGFQWNVGMTTATRSFLARVGVMPA